MKKIFSKINLRKILFSLIAVSGAIIAGENSGLNINHTIIDIATATGAISTALLTPHVIKKQE